MKCEVVVDLQFGSTGKGAVAAYLANKRTYDASVRVQSIQAGHTVYFKGDPYKMRTIPCAWVNPDTILVLGPGAFIEKQLLLDEIDMVSKATGEDVRDRLRVDFRATYIVPEDFQAEEVRGIAGSIGSTAHGAGASLIRKLWRGKPTRVIDDSWAEEHGIVTCDSIRMLEKAEVLLEGCQGTMLSIHTSPYYPFVTSRESTAAGIISEAGISPRAVTKIHGVFRTFPIRVGGNSGPTGARELTWAEVNERAGRQVEPERTTVTNKVRRIFEFSMEDFQHALRVNDPTDLYMTFADYLAPGIYGASSQEDLTIEGAQAISDKVSEIYGHTFRKVNWVGTGEKAEHFIEWP